MRKQSSIIFSALVFAAFISPQVSASAPVPDNDDYIEGFQSYAKENPELAGSIQAYVQEVEKVMKTHPDLKDTKTKTSSHTKPL